VETAGTVEGFFGTSGGHPAWQVGVLVVIVAGPVDGEAPRVGGAAVAKPAQLDHGALGVATVDVGEVGPDRTSTPARSGQRTRARSLRR